MEITGKDQSSVSGNAKGSSSRLMRYPLRLGVKPKEEKSPVTDSSNSSALRRGKPVSSVSKSVSVLDLSSKEKSGAKPSRRLSTQSKPSASPAASRSLGTVTPISEARAKKSVSNQVKTNTPLSAVSKSSIGRESSRLFSALYWLSQIKLSESAAKHTISLGFFKLAFVAGCEPLQRLRDELKSYVQRHNLVNVGESVKQLFECYNILQDFKQLQVSETISHEPEDGRSSDEEVHSSSVADAEKAEPKVLNKDAIGTCQVTDLIKEISVQKETATKTRASVNKTAATPKVKTEVLDHTNKKKIEKQKPMKQEPNKDNLKVQGKKSAQAEGRSNARTPERVLPEDKENLDVTQSEEINTGEA